MVGGKVDGQILFDARSGKLKLLFGARSEKRKNLFGAKWQLQKILFGSLRVKYGFWHIGTADFPNEKNIYYIY